MWAAEYLKCREQSLTYIKGEIFFEKNYKKGFEDSRSQGVKGKNLKLMIDY
jgi:hypothetical protein